MNIPIQLPFIDFFNIIKLNIYAYYHGNIYKNKIRILFKGALDYFTSLKYII